MVDITIVTGVYKPTYNWGAPSCIPPIFRHTLFIPGNAMMFPEDSHVVRADQLADCQSNSRLPVERCLILSSSSWLNVNISM